MREILRALRINDYTIEDYLKGVFGDEIVLDKIEGFIKEFKAYVKKEENARGSRFPFDEIISNLDVTEEDLGEFSEISKVDKAGIEISVDARRIRYRLPPVLI